MLKMATLMSSGFNLSYSKDATYIKTIHETLINNRKTVYNNILESQMESSPTSLKIVDFGTDDGSNAMMLFETLIEQSRRYKYSGHINFIFNDQPDFNFEKLTINLREFERKHSEMSTLIQPGNAFAKCLENNSIDIAFCSLVLHWLSRPIQISGGFSYNRCDEEELRNVKAIAVEDWIQFLHYRSKELKNNGYLIVRIPTSLTGFTETLSDAFDDLLSTGVITEEEYSSTNIQIYPRGIEELREPFDVPGNKLGLQLLDLYTFDVNFFTADNKEKGDFISSSIPWLYNTLNYNLSKTRKQDEIEEIAQTFFDQINNRILKSNYLSYKLDMAELVIQKK